MKHRYFLQRFVLLSSFILTACSSFDNNINRADSGFGGTGIQAASVDAEASGFGGTGFIGVISDFGSIWVNGVEVDYPDNIKIESNLPTQDQLKLGQVVILETDPQLNDAQHPTTQKVRIHYSLAGEIQQLNNDSMKVNNQWIQYSPETPMDKALKLAVGEYVAINAIQKKAQHWEASRLNTNAQHAMIKQPELKIDFSSKTHHLLADRRMSLMMKRWKITGASELMRKQWHSANRSKHKPRFPLKYQMIRKNHFDRIRMQREQMRASDRMREKRDAIIPNRPRTSRPNSGSPMRP